jgi:uncharacterized protein YndB with AHSA1/START domain
MPKTTPTASTTTKHGATTATTAEGPRPNTLTLRLVRVIKAPARRIYDCFLDADAMAKWMPPHGFTGHVHDNHAKVGGGYRMSFSTIDRSWKHTFTGAYLELVPGKRIRYTNKFEASDPVMPNTEMEVTIDFKPIKGGTELTIVQAGIPAGPAADGSPYGWSQSLDNLANLCEAELPSQET